MVVVVVAVVVVVVVAVVKVVCCGCRGCKFSHSRCFFLLRGVVSNLVPFNVSG